MKRLPGSLPFALAAAACVAAAPATVGLGPGKLVANHAELSTDARGRAILHDPLSVRFLTADWPNLTVKATAPWDWSRHGRLMLDVKNPGSQTVAFGIRVDDDPAADGTLHCRTAETSLGPGESATLALDLGRDAMSHGMRGLPGQPTARALSMTGEGPFELRHIVAMQVYLHRPPQPRTLILSKARLIPAPSLDGIVDRFGQYTKEDWPGKLHDLRELERSRNLELADLKAHPALPDRDRFGGWAQGPKLRASGSFRTAKVDGRWWLVDPDGRLFFSSGMDEVRPDFPTMISRRESMFTSLPDAADPLARFLGSTDFVHSGPVRQGRTFDFYQANLERKYGAGALRAWTETTLRRLPSWGFNTFGNWSDRFHRNGKVPYVASATVRGDHARVSSGSDYWAKMHDPFDPRFAADVERSLRELIDEVKGDPWCLGYFVDNELSWGDLESPSGLGRYGLALGTLEETTKLPAKAELLAHLRRKYGDVARLNAAWGTRLSSWESLTKPWKPEGPLSDGLKTDLADFVKLLAGRYFQTVRDALRRADPNHLYLGCRFAQYTPEALSAAAEFCDVVSFNIYAPRVDARKWGFLKDLDRPCLIGEFHVGALDRGMFHPGLVAASNQTERAAIFTDYVRSVLDHPAFVGCHWFQYVDEPLTGRTYDGENYAIGFVSVTDTPYPELVEAARSVHRDAYPRRYGTVPRTAGSPPTR